MRFLFLNESTPERIRLQVTERAVAARRQTEVVRTSYSLTSPPLGWEHANLTGDHIWSAERPVTESRDGRSRPLRAAPDTARKAA
jgi:hypothetical protein